MYETHKELIIFNEKFNDLIFAITLLNNWLYFLSKDQKIAKAKYKALAETEEQKLIFKKLKINNSFNVKKNLIGYKISKKTRKWIKKDYSLLFLFINKSITDLSNISIANLKNNSAHKDLTKLASKITVRSSVYGMSWSQRENIRLTEKIIKKLNKNYKPIISYAKSLETRYQFRSSDSITLIIPNSFAINTFDETFKELQKWKNHLISFGRLVKNNEPIKLISIEKGSIVAVLGVEVIIIFAILIVVDKALDVLKKVYEIQKLHRTSKSLELDDITNKLFEKVKSIPNDEAPRIVEFLLEKYPYKFDDKNEVKNSLLLAVKFIISFMLRSGEIEYNIMEVSKEKEEKILNLKNKRELIEGLRKDILDLDSEKVYEKLLAEEFKEDS